MTLEFRKPNRQDVEAIEDFKSEFQAHNSVMEGTNILVKSSAEEWLAYVAKSEARDSPDILPCFYYGLFEKESGRLLGIIQIRLKLNDYLSEFGGHIGYCVRPTERRKGYAKTMLRNALGICKEEGLHKVMISCVEENNASENTIKSCGGVFEKKVYDERCYKAYLKRYWIALSKENDCLLKSE